MRVIFFVSVVFATAAALAQGAPRVQLIRVPDNGVALQCVLDHRNTLHLIYATGDPRHATLHYSESNDLGKTLFGALPVCESALVMGSVRNPQLLVASDGQSHIGWMKSSSEFLYTSITQTGSLNPAKNLLPSPFTIDGGAALVMAPDDTLYFVFHAPADPKDASEANRRIYICKSTDNGNSFSAPTRGKTPPAALGVCACCALNAFATNDRLYVLYRCATDRIHRDVHLLSFDSDLNCNDDQTLSRLTANKCIMSTASFARSGDHVYVAYESGSNVFVHRIDAPLTVAAPGTGNNRKHPVVASNNDGIVLMTWTENTSFNQGGSIAWQLFTADLKPIGEVRHAPDLPANSIPAAFPSPGSSFVVMY